jgi:hypothetical protein
MYNSFFFQSPKTNTSILQPSIILMASFGQRFTPQPLFESYTPTELALQRMTLASAAWTDDVGRMAGRTLLLHELETYFRHYINDKFPLQEADPSNFALYVVEEERKKDRRKRSEPKLGLWWYSHPSGQAHFSYPSVEHREEPASFDMSRLG